MSGDLAPVPVERYEAGYVPRWEFRTIDAYIWRDRRHPAMREHPGESWCLRTGDAANLFTTHRTLRDARVEATRRLGLDLRES